VVRLLVTTAGSRDGVDREEALLDGTKVDVNLHLVVLESNERKSQTRVVTEPELERNVKSRLRKSIARSANLVRRSSITWAINRGESRIRQESKLSGLANHLVVTTLLVRIHRELDPKLHPVSVLLVDALTSDLDLDGIDQLMAREIEPASIHTPARRTVILINLRKSYLEIRAVSKVSVSRNGAGYTATEITLSIESLLNRLHSKVSVAAVSDLPIGNLRVTSQINILSTISY
jgi:hypothetical protein